ncbi:MAG: hypothetical protein JXA30_20985 [Deltaproteobacteria bacterium]|nr:hypothetical protein [Deltaproteobacteria bacterium]
MKALIEITPPHRASHRRALSGKKVSVGRGSNCDISLPEERELLEEHFFIFLLDSGCKVALSPQASTLVSYQGRSFRDGHIPWGEEIFVVGIRFRLMLQTDAKARRGFSAVCLSFLPVLIAAGAWSLLALPKTGDSNNPRGPRPSELFDEQAECSQPNAAGHRAREAEKAAFARMERYPFAHREGVEAVRLIGEAQRCYLEAKEKAEAIRVKKTLDAWTGILNRDYQIYRLQLRFALEKGREEEARARARELRNLLSHRNDGYTKWLDGIAQKRAPETLQPD